VVSQPLPGLLSGLCGVEVDEYDVLPAGMTVPISLQFPGTDRTIPAKANTWCDVLEPTTAQPFAEYGGEYYIDRCAATLKEDKNGKVVYLGAFGDSDLYEPVMDWLLENAEVEPFLNAPEGIEAVERWKDDKRFIFLLNHTGEQKKITLPETYKELLSNQILEGNVQIEPRSVLILESISKD
jgi:beta-galactosidase